MGYVVVLGARRTIIFLASLTVRCDGTWRISFGYVSRAISGGCIKGEMWS